jgi:hypothetical protein
MDTRVDFLRLPHQVVDSAGGDSFEVLLFRKRVARRGDQLEVVSVKLIRDGQIGIDESAKAPALQVSEIRLVHVASVRRPV